jgi:hypothetical protein
MTADDGRSTLHDGRGTPGLRRVTIKAALAVQRSDVVDASCKGRVLQMVLGGAKVGKGPKFLVIKVRGTKAQKSHGFSCMLTALLKSKVSRGPVGLQWFSAATSRPRTYSHALLMSDDGMNVDEEMEELSLDGSPKAARSKSGTPLKKRPKKTGKHGSHVGRVPAATPKEVPSPRAASPPPPRRVRSLMWRR